MTDAQKLEALVRKAKIVPQKDFELMAGVTVANAVLDYCEWLIQTESTALFLFNRHVARALFGAEFNQSVAQYVPNTGESENPDKVEDWYGRAHYDGPTFEYQLMMAVISDDPIGYMYKAVFDK